MANQKTEAKPEPTVRAVWLLGENRGIPTHGLSYLSGALDPKDGWTFDVSRATYIVATRLNGKGQRVTLQLPRSVALVELHEEE
jgi:hypothetical protein